MRYGDRTDAELMASAQAGLSPAFAVLLHRHGPAVRSAVHHDPDPIAATRDVFLTALEELPRMDPQFPVRDWLLDIAGTDQVPDPIVPLDEQELDAIWASLLTAWPGRPRPPRTALRRAALIGGLVALAALVPTLVFLADEAPEPVADELSAHPVADESRPEEEPTEADEEPLPTFSFPSVAEQEPRPTSTPTTEPVTAETSDPPPDPAPTVTVTDEPDPDPSGEPDPDPSGEPDPDPSGEPDPDPSGEPDPDPDPEPEPDPDPSGEPDPEPDPTETSEPPVEPLPPLGRDADDGDSAGTS